MNSHYMKYVISVISRRFGWKCVEKETMKGQMKNLLGVEMLFHQDSAQMFDDALSWLRLLKRNHPDKVAFGNFQLRRLTIRGIYITFYISI